jgi:hypothetical protein
LIQIVRHWQYLEGPPESPCPVTFTDTELQEHVEQESEWNAGAALVDHWRQQLGDMSEEGWVRTEVYEHAVVTNQELKKTWLGEAGDDEKERRQVEAVM